MFTTHDGRWLLGMIVVAGAAAHQAVAAGPGEAEALFAQARGHLEEVLHYRFDKPPALRIPTETELREWQDPVLEAQIRWQFPDLAGEALDRTLAAARAACRSAALAHYREGTNEILILPGNQATIARWDDSLKGVASARCLQLALVHEAALLALDRRYHCPALRRACRDAEEFQALQAVIEGRAQSATRQVARRVGAEDVFPLLARLYLHVPDPDPDPGLREASQEVVRKRSWWRERGLAFFDYAEAHQPAGAERQVFTHLPRQATWIERPHLFSRAVQGDWPSLESVLTRLQKALPEAEWTSQQQSWTPAMTRQVADMLNEGKRAEQVLGSWDEGRMLVWTAKTDPLRQVAVAVVRFESAAAARSYHAFALDLQRKEDVSLGGAGGFPRVVATDSRSLSIPGAEEVVWNEKQLQFSAGGAPVRVTTLLARASSMVISITWHGIAGDAKWAESIVKAVVPVTPAEACRESPGQAR
jgi:hypothetical protein